MATAAPCLSEIPRDTLQAQFRAEVLQGLSQPRKAIPARWFYDRRGSELFEEITQLEEYYPTRTEIGILTDRQDEIGRAVGSGRVIVEFGAGSATKTPLLLDAAAPSAYLPIDISGDFLRDACGPLEDSYPELPIVPAEADFMQPIAIEALLPDGMEQEQRLGFFPGSTIGNMEPRAAIDLLRSMRETLGPDSLLLIGMDRVKPRPVLEAAYDDARGVTAAFNLNLAARINRELDGSLPLDGLRHRAVWNDRHARIEMHLVAQRDIGFEVCGRHFTMDEGETIHTENSHKYDMRSAATLLLGGGWEPLSTWCDEDSRFMVVLARAMRNDLSA
ncbi:L-histidine N(alpha)-methyltransferase [Novosphingobium sp. PY1]|uniref:L-histidine N(alpha)-methyltransferase n=1 Tax=Novosphingobium sp. PY1 TaxID=1882221 RepID=UPI001A8D46AF|nr:L-histidine N(alpha)-methyltransferase [Novosphingobium sp. PY1]GFM29902.1 methyltransferase [Novosphingobium sp. PY1]